MIDVVAPSLWICVASFLRFSFFPLYLVGLLENEKSRRKLQLLNGRFSVPGAFEFGVSVDTAVFVGEFPCPFQNYLNDAIHLSLSSSHGDLYSNEGVSSVCVLSSRMGDDASMICKLLVVCGRTWAYSCLYVSI